MESIISLPDGVSFAIEIRCTDFPLEVQISKKQRAKYYTKRGKYRIPTKYQKNPQFKMGKLVDENGEYVLRNPTQAGQPKMLRLSGNVFLSSQKHVKNTVVTALHEYYDQFVTLMPPIDNFPIIIEWGVIADMHDPEFRWDMSNMWHYYKYFEDNLQKNGIIPNDSKKYVVGAPGPVLYPERGKRDLLFRIHTDNRHRVINHPYWKYL